tara:strand:+ start:100 stop:267 length:168 start_codon:yes stop_codon:yes gene_type:complete
MAYKIYRIVEQVTEAPSIYTPIPEYNWTTVRISAPSESRAEITLKDIIDKRELMS